MIKYVFGDIMVKKVLCVDDSKVVLNFIKKNIEKEGVEVLFVTKSEDVFPFALKKDIDLYIVDYMMYDMKGNELAKKILDIHSDARILIYSVMDQEKLKEEFKGIKILGFIEKDFYVDNLIKKINDALV
jgi:DNA-binding response OmpR family regulator